MQIYGLVEETSALFVTSHPEFGNIHNQDPALNYLSVTYQPKSNVYPRQEMIWVPRTMPKGVTDNIAIQPAAGTYLVKFMTFWNKHIQTNFK